MNIHAPEITTANGITRLAARVETQTQINGLPGELWYEFPEAFGGMAAVDMEAFVVPLVPFAMRLGEDIHVAGEFSPQLFYHLVRYQQIYSFYEPRTFRPVQIIPSGLRATPLERAPGVGVMFSGGVDSFYTLYRHLPERQPIPEFRLTHGIFLFHFDLQGYERASYRKASQLYQQLFREHGLTLIPANFNSREFQPGGSYSQRRRWANKAIGAVLAGAGLAFGRGLGRLLLASPHTLEFVGFTGSSMPLDQSLSTEWLEVVHDSLVEDRADKTIALADWPATHDTLRVCWWDPDGVQNCGRCAKCIRTMTTLEAAGKLDAYTVFPKPLRRGRILPRLSAHSGGYYLPGMIRLALRNRRWDLFILLWIARLIGRLRGALKRFVRVFAPGFEGW